MCICLITPGISGNYSPISEISAEIDRYPGTRARPVPGCDFSPNPGPGKNTNFTGILAGI